MTHKHMLMRLLILVIIVQLGIVPRVVPQCWAHDAGDHDDQLQELLRHDTIHALHEHLARVLEKSVRYGEHLQTEDEQRVGEVLLEGAYETVLAGVRGQKPALSTEAGRVLRKIIAPFNPRRLGRMVLDLAYRHGALVAAAIGFAEVTEQAGVFLSFFYPELRFMVPLYFTHIVDVVAVGLALGLPKALRTLKLWKRFGGPKGYFHHLIAQRQALPFDWEVVIDVKALHVALDGKEEPKEIVFAIMESDWRSRMLPRAVRVVLDARRLAQEESVATFSIADLERRAKGAGVDLRWLRVFKAEPAIYSGILVREILQKDLDARRAFFADLLKKRPFDRGLLYDADRLLRTRSEVEIQELAAENGESLDLLATRALWRLRDEQERLFDRAKVLDERTGRRPGIDVSRARKHLRELGRLLGGRRGLKSFSGLPAQAVSTEDWTVFYNLLAEARLALGNAKQLLGLTAHAEYCEELLTGQTESQSSRSSSGMKELN